MSIRISVIVPTVGRDTLQAALDSCAGADEVIVVEDTDRRDRGYWARTEGIRQATGTHLAFLDDDDVFTPGAIEIMRSAACDVPTIFRMDDPTWGVLWRDPVLRYANVGTPMFLIPNDQDRLGVWAPFENDRGGDYTFVTGCVEKMGAPVWREEVVCVVRPHERTPTVTVVTPWLNRHEFLPDYELAMEVGRPDELIVVDNGSDPAVDLPGIRLDYNSGFSHACNLGLEAASSDAVLFLNNDIAATAPDWLRSIRAALEPGVLVGANLRRDEHGDVDGQKLSYLDGWCLAGMTDDLRELDGWDETFAEPAYFGDNDLCFRARMEGMTLRETKVGLHHKSNGTLGVGHPDSERAGRANYLLYASRVRDMLTVNA